MIEQLQNRAVSGGAETEAELARIKGKRPKADPMAETPTIAERIQIARDLKAPRGLGGGHCGCCFGAGRDAALRVIEGANA
jgi:hypothetical protein